MLRYGGRRWATLPRTGIKDDLRAIWVVDPNHVYVASHVDTHPISRLLSRTRKNRGILRYDGKAWTPQVGNGSSRAFWGRGDQVFAVGDYGNLYHFDGKDWNTPDTGTTRSLYAVWGTAEHTFVVGERGAVLAKAQ